MNAHIIRRSAVLLGASIIGSALLLVPAAAQAAPLVAEDAPTACVVTDGTLDWGVKESFRSYISGSIANGSWEATDGASYDTPDFTWSGATGSIDPESGTGTVSFAGTVHFTGHDGVLDLTLANPTLEFEGEGKASLLLDARSTDASGEVTIDSSQEWVGDVVAPRTLPVTAEGLTAEDMTSELTNSGAKAFAGFYEAGAALDPISVALTFDSCDTSGVAASTEDVEPTQDALNEVAPVESEQIPWIPIVIGGVAILVIGVTAGMLVSGRKRPNRDESTPAAEEASAPE